MPDTWCLMEQLSDLKVHLCRYCKGRIIWAESQRNPRARKEHEIERAPFDAEPDDYANYVLTTIPGKPPVFGMMGRNQAAGFRANGGHTYQKHFKTCTQWPKRKEWAR